jgi:hypothetical protein
MANDLTPKAAAYRELHRVARLKLEPRPVANTRDNAKVLAAIAVATKPGALNRAGRRALRVLAAAESRRPLSEHEELQLSALRARRAG